MTALAADLVAGLDRAAFARILGVAPDEWQASVLRSEAKRTLLLCARQTGKSLTAGLVALHTARYQPGSQTLIVSPSLRQSQELFATIARLNGSADPGRTQSKRETASQLELASGGRILSLPASEATIRGFSGIDLLILDEAGWIPDGLYHALVPMLATSDGSLLACSTPAGKRGWFYQAWSGDASWHRVHVTAAQCPRISAAFLEEQRAALGEAVFRAEFEAEFVDASGQLFASELLQAAMAEGEDTWII